MLPFHDEPALLDAFRLWDALRQGRAVPDRKDLDPVLIPARLFPDIALIDVLEQGSRVRFRLLGENLVHQFGTGRIGVFFDEFIRGSYLKYTKSYYRDLYQHRRPVYSASELRTASGWHCLTKRLVMPLTAGGEEITMAFAAQIFRPTEDSAPTRTAVVLDTLDAREVSRSLVAA